MILQLDSKKLQATLKKAVAINSQPTEESFPELPTILIWMRFVLGAAYGTYIGTQGIKSGTMALQCLNLVAFLPWIYTRLYLGVGGEQFVSDALFAGTVQGVALALLIWVYFYTAQMEDQEQNLSSMLIPPSLDDNIGMAGEAADSMAEETLSVPLVGEEF